MCQYIICWKTINKCAFIRLRYENTVIYFHFSFENLQCWESVCRKKLVRIEEYEILKDRTKLIV